MVWMTSLGTCLPNNSTAATHDMFRQVVAYRWVEGVTDEAKQACRESLETLRAIPELTQLAFGDDARHFEGNFDMVAVMDFPDFAAARRYVADPRHQAYIHDHVVKLVGERVVVQHDWAIDEVAGIHHVTLPVSDIERSREWYEAVLNLVVDELSTPEDASHEVVIRHRSSPFVVTLRHDPTRAKALAGFDLVALSVATHDDMRAILARLDARGVSYVINVVPIGEFLVAVADPDGIVVTLACLLPADAPDVS